MLVKSAPDTHAVWPPIPPLVYAITSAFLIDRRRSLSFWTLAEIVIVGVFMALLFAKPEWVSDRLTLDDHAVG